MIYQKRIVPELIMITLLLCGPFVSFCQSTPDKIIKQDNTVIDCKVLKVTNNTVEINPKGDIPFLILDREEIKMIIYSDNTVVNLKDGSSEKSSKENGDGQTKIVAETPTGWVSFPSVILGQHFWKRPEQGYDLIYSRHGLLDSKDVKIPEWGSYDFYFSRDDDFTLEENVYFFASYEIKYRQKSLVNSSIVVEDFQIHIQCFKISGGLIFERKYSLSEAFHVEKDPEITHKILDNIYYRDLAFQPELGFTCKNSVNTLIVGLTIIPRPQANVTYPIQ